MTIFFLIRLLNIHFIVDDVENKWLKGFAWVLEGGQNKYHQNFGVGISVVSFKTSFFLFFSFFESNQNFLDAYVNTYNDDVFEYAYIFLGFNSYFGVCKDELLYRALASSPIIDVISHD